MSSAACAAGCAQLDVRTRTRDAMQLLEDPNGLGDVLDHILEQNLIEAVVGDRVREDIEVVNYVRIGAGRDVEPDRSRRLCRAAPHVEDFSEPLGGEIETVRIGELAAPTRRSPYVFVR
jgi:hypothetical protein